MLTYLPQVRLQQLGQPGGFAPLDDGYFNRLQVVREQEERRLRDALRDVPTPWLKAGLNALAQVGTAPILLLLSGASSKTASYSEALRQTRLLPYRAGQEEQKGETAEIVLGAYGALLGPWASGVLRTTAYALAREIPAAVATLRTEQVLSAPRLNPLNYRLGVRGLGSNLGNAELRYIEPGVASRSNVAAPAAATAGAEDVAEHASSFDQARRMAFERAGLTDANAVMFTKEDPVTGTIVEFKGPGGAKVAYDAPHASPGPGHDKPHIGWQTAGKRGGGARRGNITYDGPQHPHRPAEKGSGVLTQEKDTP